MPKNKVQFKKGLSLKAFFDRHGFESQCEQALGRILWPSGFNCPACGSSSFCGLDSLRLLQCNRCKRQVLLLAGTIFQSTKLPLSTWFLDIYLLADVKNGISALELGRQQGVSNNTVWLFKHKLVQAMRERDRGGKRCRGSNNETPLVTAIRVTGTTVKSDGLACFGREEAAGCRQEAIVTGGGPGSCERTGLTYMNTLLGNAKQSMHGSYHSIQPRYLAR